MNKSSSAFLFNKQMDIEVKRSDVLIYGKMFENVTQMKLLLNVTGTGMMWYDETKIKIKHIGYKYD